MRMKDFPGTPGTLTGLFLRISQCIFAASSIAFLAATDDFINISGFSFLLAAMSMQAFWSFGLAILNLYSLASMRVLNSHLLINIFVVGDWVTAMLSLAAASASGGIIMLFLHGSEGCVVLADCRKFQLSVASAFLSWFAAAISSLIMLWIMA